MPKTNNGYIIDDDIKKEMAKYSIKPKPKQKSKPGKTNAAKTA